MPGLIGVNALFAVVAGSAMIALATLALVMAHQIVTSLIGGRHARADEVWRPAVMRAAMTGPLQAELEMLRGHEGEAVERICYEVLRRVKGEARTRVTKILLCRGAERNEIQASHRRRANARAGAAERLGLIASAAAELRLIELLTSDQSRQVRIVAARALGQASSPGAATALLGLIRHDSYEYGGVEIATPVETHPREVPSGILASALLDLGTSALPELRAAAATTASDEIAQRALAIDLLGMLKDLRSWQILASGLGSGYPSVRLAAARALGQLGLREPVWDLTRHLAADEVPAVRLTAAWALGRIRDPACAQALSQCLDDPDHLIAHSAALALGALGEIGQRQLRHKLLAGRSGAPYAREGLSMTELSGRERPPATAPPAASRPWRIGPPIAGLTR